MDRDRITRTGARAPGLERQKFARKCTSALRPPTQNGAETRQAVGTKGRTQTGRREDLTEDGKAPSEIPALKPYWGKPAVRDFRGSDGNVGIIRGPVRAIALPGGLRGAWLTNRR